MALADLTTLTAVKAWLGIDVSNTASDTLLTAMCADFSQAARTYCAQTFDLATYVERRDGNGNTRLLLRERPVVSITSVVADGQALTASDGTSQGYLVDGDGLGLVMIGGDRLPAGTQNLVITYRAGYDRTGTDSLPTDLKQAIKEWIGFVYKERSRIGEESKSIGPETVSFYTDTMPKRVATILNIYARRIPL